MSSESSSLRFRTNLLGAIALAGYVLMALLSYAQAPVLWRSEIAQAPRAVAFFEALDRQFEAFPIYSSIKEVISSVLTSNAAVIASYWIPLGITTVAMMLMLSSLVRYRAAADAAIAGLLLRWSLTFAMACSLAIPIFTQDLWLSAVWGRMIVAGVNPYYSYFTPEALQGLPLDHFPMVMSYGPLWGLLAGAVTAISRDSVLVTSILSKGLLAATWVGSLVLIGRIVRERPGFDRCLAVALFGWTPVSVTQSLAEGHNDIVMVFFLLLWFSLLLRGNRLAPVALVASILCKYVTAPLFAIDAIHLLRAEHGHWRAYAIRLLVPAAFALSVFAVFYRSPEFFDGLRVISEWRFLQPRDAVSALAYLTGIGLAPLEFAVTALFPALAVYYCVACFRRSTVDDIPKATIAILASISFAAISHLWPWYMIWSLAFAAMLPAWWLSRFVVGVAVMAPFAVVWWISPFAFQMAAPVVYGGAILWMLATRHMPGDPAALGQRGTQDVTPPRYSA